MNSTNFVHPGELHSPIDAVLSRLSNVREQGKGWQAPCPAHDDNRASLTIGEGNDGKALLKCHAGCNTEKICSALGLQVSDLFPKPNSKPLPRKKQPPKELAHYDYTDEHGELVFQVVRLEPKDFRQRRPKPGGGWDWSVKGVRQVPYRLKDLTANPSQTVAIVEGEKDCDNLARLGILATCNAGGAGKWLSDHAQHLQGRKVVIFSDNDDAGRNHAQQVAQSLAGLAVSIKIVNLPGLPPKGDVSDWLAAGGTKDELIALVREAEEWNPSQAQVWPDLLTFENNDLPEFPTAVLPGVLREWVEAESHATQTPADLAAMLALAVCSACIARRVTVEPRPGWREPSNIYTAILLEPGNRKSAVFNDAIRPLRELEAEMVEAARPAVAQAQSERRQAEARLRKLEKTAAEANGSDSFKAREEAIKLAADLAEQPEPVLPRLVVDDATQEKLGMMLAQQDGRLASMSPEGGVFDLMAGLYSKSGAPNLGVYLMGHSGDDLITDRVGRASVRVERPALTCAYAMQPSVVAALGEHVAFRGRGLLARFLYAAPRSWIGEREIAPTPVSDSTREAYRQLVRTLAQVSGDFILCLDADAERLFRTWERDTEEMLADGGQMEVLRDWGAKLAGATLRLAAVLHCVESGPGGTINRETIGAAIAIGDYLIPHAEAVLAMMQAKEDDGAEQDARYILNWITRHGLEEFTKSQAQQHGKRRFPKAEDIDRPLNELMARGYIRHLPTAITGPGRPASPVFTVNPKFLESQTSRKRPNNSKKPK